MHLHPETITAGVSERLFNLGEITGVLWSPADGPACLPLVLIGHGGGQHKKAPGVTGRAHRYVTQGGFAVAAIDAPAHGDRPKSDRDEQFGAWIRTATAAGEPVLGQVERYNAELAVRAVPDWQRTLDALQAPAVLGNGGPVGYCGLSMGCLIGVPLAAAEPRIRAAVFGLAGPDTLAETAGRVTIPVEFVLQWDDEQVPRDSGLALFSAFASAEKTLHANPGRHGEVPRFEADSSLRFFARHLVNHD